MRTCVLMVVLALAAVWASGCIIIDADRMESHRSATTRFEECVIRQGVPHGGAPDLHRDAAESEATWVTFAE
jgi:hypothetical protein